MAVEQRLVQAGVVRLECFEAGDGERAAVLVHGASSSARIWHVVQERLAEAGMRTLAPGMRGAGGSDHTPDAADYNPRQYAADLAAALEELGLARFTLVGHSLGVSVALHFMRDRASRFDVRALALMAGGSGEGRPAPTAEQMAEIEARTARRSAAPEALRRHQREVTHVGLPDEVREALARDVANNPPQRMRGQATGERPDLTPVLASMPMHTLVLSGDADSVVPLGRTLGGYLALPPERRHLHVFHGVDHFPNAQIPDRLAGVLTRFIEVHAPA